MREIYRVVSRTRGFGYETHIACFLDKELAESYAKRAAALSPFNDYDVVKSILYEDFP